jgi:hypothetical protein
MRRVLGLVACLAAALLAAACDLTTDSRYFREGIGTSLYATDMPEATQLQEQYLGILCEQAGLQPVLMGDGFLHCDSPDWTLIVQTGMNDVDRRCDAYLGWLDNRKRSIEPVLKQLSETSVFTQSVLRATGVGANPITIVGLAFGLAADTFTNVNSRLLLEVDHSTVQAVVLSNQNKYREGLQGQRIDNRATAIYALRSYLRLCEPFTIETQINTTVTLFERGGIAAVASRPLITPKTVGTVVPVAALTPRTVIGKPIRVASEDHPEYAQILDPYNGEPPAYVERLQRALCVPPSEYRSVGDATKILIRIFENAEPSASKNGKLDLREQNIVLGLAGNPCTPDGPQNFYERRTYTSSTAIADLIGFLRRSPAGGDISPNASLKQARAKIRDVRAALASKLTLKLTEPFASQVTSDLINALDDLPDAPGSR